MVQTAELLQRDAVQGGGLLLALEAKKHYTKKKKKCCLVSFVQNGAKLRRLKDIKFFELSVV
jgi:hypothetical protein